MRIGLGKLKMAGVPFLTLTACRTKLEGDSGNKSTNCQCPKASHDSKLIVRKNRCEVHESVHFILQCRLREHCLRSNNTAVNADRCDTRCTTCFRTSDSETYSRPRFENTRQRLLPLVAAGALFSKPWQAEHTMRKVSDATRDIPDDGTQPAITAEQQAANVAEYNDKNG